MKDLGKKKLIMIGAGIIGLVILIIVILLVYNAVFGKVTYESIENKVLNAAKEYYADHTELLPKNANEEVSTTDSALTSAGYLESMSKLTSKMKGVSCKATVMVSYAGGDYRYTPLLDCGKKYSSKTLASYIENNVEKVFDGSGLYDLNGELVYRGEAPNNYIKFSDKMWRVVKVSDKQVIIILDEKFVRNVWDDRYNADKNTNDGINDYGVSRIKDLLSDTYEDSNLFNKNTKNLLANHTLYVGKRSESDNFNDGSLEKGLFLKNQYIGLLPLYDYINASVDANCESAITASCSNYNYLSHYDYNWWTLTGDSSTSHKVFRISSSGVIETLRASSNGYVRPVIYLAKDALYVKGDGTLENPFIIK